MDLKLSLVIRVEIHLGRDQTWQAGVISAPRGWGRCLGQAVQKIRTTVKAQLTHLVSKNLILATAMPGPRAKQNGAKKNKQRPLVSHDNAALGSISPGIISTDVLDTLNEFSNDDWDRVAKVLCDYLELPGPYLLITRPRMLI